MQNYIVTVNFGGYIGADNDYEVYAEDKDDARNIAFDMAKEDLTIEDIVQVDEDEWEVSVGFAGFIGVEEVYTVQGEDEEDAIDAALEEASYDLDAEIEGDDD